MLEVVQAFDTVRKDVLGEELEATRRLTSEIKLWTIFGSVHQLTSPQVTFEVDGFRFSCALGKELHYPEIFTEYEQLDVDCVLFSTTGEAPSSARLSQRRF